MAEARARRPAPADQGRADIAFVGGLINYVLTSEKYFHPAPDTDVTLQHPRCVFQVLRRHFAR